MFDKIKFKDLLNQAIGDRSISTYAKESGVSRSYISQYINEKLDKPPSPEVIIRLAEASNNRISYLELMQAAGHFDIKKSEDIINYVKEAELAYLQDKNSYTKKFIYELLKMLQQTGIIDGNGQNLLDEKEAELILNDLKTKLDIIQKFKDKC
jgi:transcriptional regulator with XRE-family HTH domain